MIAANRAGLVGPRKWDPDLGPAWELERFRHDADDGIGFAIKKDAAADDIAIGSEMVAPEIVAEQDDVTLAGAVFVRCERTAQQWLDTEQRKKIRSDRRGLNSFGTLFSADVEGPESVSGHVFERGTLAPPVEVVGRRYRKHGQAGETLGWRNVPDLQDAGRVVEG